MFSSSKLRIDSLGKTAFFITGIDSPVSILSFIIADPLNRIRSQGNAYYSGTTITSPGTKSPL